MQDQELVKQLSDYIMNELATGSPAGPLTPDSQLVEDGFVDSLGLFKLVAYMEDKLNVTLEPEEIVFENFATINTIVGLIQSKQSGSTGA